MNVLIDSDILIEVTRGRAMNLLEKWTAMGESEAVLLCSPVTVAELWHGALPREHKMLDDLFTGLLCVPIDQEIGRLAGGYLRQYAASHGVELGDALIAASAVVHKAVLWTRNLKHYPMKPLEFLVD